MTTKTVPFPTDRDRNLSRIIDTIEDDGPSRPATAASAPGEGGRGSPALREPPRKDSAGAAGGRGLEAAQGQSRMARSLTTAGVLIAAVVASAVVGHGFYTLDPAPGGNHPTARARDPGSEQRVEQRLPELEKSLLAIDRRLDALTAEHQQIIDRVERRLSREMREKGQEMAALRQQLIEVNQSSRQLLQQALQLTQPVTEVPRPRARESVARTPEAASGSVERRGSRQAAAGDTTRSAVARASPGAVPADRVRAAPERRVKTAPTRERPSEWVINLIAVGNRDKAEQLQRQFARQGIDSYVIEIPATKTRQRLFGLRMDGFATREEARSATPEVKRRLGLDEVLISSK
jgi:cell division septation protein DedD